MNSFDLDRFIQSLDTSDWIKSGRIKESTKRAYRTDIQQFCDWLSKNNARLSSAGPLEVQAYLSELAHIRRPSSVRRAGVSLRRLFEYLGKAPLKGKGARLELPSRSRPFTRAIDERSIEALAHQLSGDRPVDSRDFAIFQLLYSCGLRLSEIVALDLSELRLREKLIRPTGKGNVARVIPFEGEADFALRQWAQHDRRQFLIQNGVTDQTEALFVNREGTRLSRQSVERSLKEAGQKAGLKKPVAPHMIRDTCARVMLRNGASRADVDRLFGHVTLIGHKRMDRDAIEQLRTLMAATHPSWQKIIAT